MNKVREALRRSRAETRDLRGDLFQAETMIKNLTRNKSKRRVRAAKASSSGRGCGELESECEERRMSTSLIAGDENDSISPADRMVESFTGGLVNRVRQREWDSRLVNEAAQRSRNGGGQQGVTAAGTRRGILVEVCICVVSPIDNNSVRENCVLHNLDVVGGCHVNIYRGIFLVYICLRKLHTVDQSHDASTLTHVVVDYFGF